MSSEARGVSGVEYLAIGCMMGQMTGVRERKRIGDPSATSHVSHPRDLTGRGYGGGVQASELDKGRKDNRTSWAVLAHTSAFNP